MSNKKEKKEEFNIPINIFGRKKPSEYQTENKKDIIPVMISEKEETRKESASDNLLPASQPAQADADWTQARATADKQEKREFFDYEKMDLKNKAAAKKIAWVKRKSEAERRKMMWAVVVCFMVVILSVWAIFLKYNILLENLSIKQMQRDEEWSKIKDEFDQSYKNFENIVEDYNQAGSAKIDAQVGASAETEVENEKKEIDISNEDIEKLKEKIIEKSDK